MTSPGGFSSRASAFALDPAVTRLIASVLAIALLSWSAMRSTRVASTRRTELARANGTLSAFADLRRRYEPAVAAESIAWRRTWMALQELGVVGDERLTVTHSVTRAAEAAGLRDVRVSIGPADTTGSEGRLSTEGVRRKAAPFGLLVEFRGGLRPVVAFLGHLPPSVAATHLSLVRGDDRISRISLAVYELTFANGPPQLSLWSSAERDDPRRGGSGRPGG